MNLPQISRYENFKFIYLLHFFKYLCGESIYQIVFFEIKIQFEFQLNSYLDRNTNNIIYLDTQNDYIYLHGFK